MHVFIPAPPPGMQVTHLWCLKGVIKLNICDTKVATAMQRERVQHKKSVDEHLYQVQHDIPFWFPFIIRSQYTACLGETKGDVKGKTEAADKTSTKAKQINEDQHAQPVEGVEIATLMEIWTQDIWLVVQQKYQRLARPAMLNHGIHVVLAREDQLTKCLHMDSCDRLDYHPNEQDHSEHDQRSLAPYGDITASFITEARGSSSLRGIQ